MKILSIESSCDETAAAVIEDGRKIISSVINTQVAEHGLYGGVVPEIASRRHTENIVGVVEQALADAEMSLSDVDYIAVTAAPGLIGALLVGVSFAKGLSLATGKPLIPVHHLRGHIAANYLAHPDLEPPFLCLVVSGGHSHIVTTRASKFSEKPATTQRAKPLTRRPAPWVCPTPAAFPLIKCPNRATPKRSACRSRGSRARPSI